MTTTLLLIAIAVVALVAFALSSKTPTDPAPLWELGPIIRGENYSAGATIQPHPEGWAIDIPEAPGSVHYVTQATGPLTGKTLIRLRYRLEAEPAVGSLNGILAPVKSPNSPSIITLYFQHNGDNWSAKGEYEAYRWYAGFANHSPVTPGNFILEAPLDGPWGAILTSTRGSNPEGFQQARDNAGRVGFVLGGGDGLGHGVSATGPAKLVILSFEVL